MRSRIVLWGTNDKDERVLLALQLIAEDNTVKIHAFPEKSATEIFYNLMMNEWRQGHEVEFPEDYEVVIRPLTASDTILPDHLKVQRTDVITRAQTEWHFIVLSAKLYQSYKSEIEDLKERIGGLKEFESGIWEELKGFWSKVQTQVNERNLFREHANHLRDETNSMFDQLKSLRRAIDQKLREQSEVVAKKYHEALDVIEKKIEGGLGLKPLFEELKRLQNDFKNSDIVRRDRDKLRKRIDRAFKAVKQKRFGDSESGSDNKLARLTRRYDGLMKAIGKMKSSIGRDKKDIEFEEKRISSTDGQLEAQIRTAKLNMIRERIDSKQEKLDEMLKIQTTLESQIATETERAEKAKMMAAAEEEAKAKIAEDIAHDKVERMENEDELKVAAEKIKASKKAKKTAADQKEKEGTGELLSAVKTTIGESLLDVVDTIKAVAEVVSDQVEDMIDDMKSEEE